MQPKYVFLIFIVGIVGMMAYCSAKTETMFRPYGERGAVYETWETRNEAFKVKITARHEINVYMPGAYYICEVAAAGTDDWREFKAIRADDPNPILRERFQFVNAQTAYLYTTDDFSVTVDGGRTWKVWQPRLPQPDGKLEYWGIINAHVEANGTGRAKLTRYDEQVKDRVETEVRTADFGQTWNTKKP